MMTINGRDIRRNADQEFSLPADCHTLMAHGLGRRGDEMWNAGVEALETHLRIMIIKW